MIIGVHTSHCCAEHGCKYGDAACPVVLGTHRQEYACEDCLMEVDEMQERAAFYAKHPRKLQELLNAILKTADVNPISRTGAGHGLAGMAAEFGRERDSGH